MPGYAIQLALQTASRENTRNVYHQPGPPPRGSKYPTLQEIAERCIGPDEVISEGLAVSRLEAHGLGNDATVVVNGTSIWCAAMLCKGLWQWDDYKAGTLRRWQPAPEVFARSVFRPPAPVSRETKTLRDEIAELRRQITGVDDVPHIHVEDGNRLIINRAKHPANVNLLRRSMPHGKVLPNEILEVDAATCSELVGHGVLEEISVNDAADVMAAYQYR